MKKRSLTPMSPSVQACSHSSMKVSSPLKLHKENKNYMKENKNLSYKLQISLNSTLCLVVPSASDVWGIYRIEMDQEMSLKIREANYL